MAITFQIQIDKFRRSVSRPAGKKTGKKFEEIKFSRSYMPDKATRIYFSDLRRAIKFERTGEKANRTIYNFPFCTICVDRFSNRVLIYRVSGWMGDAPILHLIKKRKI